MLPLLVSVELFRPEPSWPCTDPQFPRRAIFLIELSMARERGGDWDGLNVNEDHIAFATHDAFPARAS